MNKHKRVLYSAILSLIPSARKRADYIRKHHLYGSVGKQCTIGKRKLPLYSNLVFLHDNVRIAANVGFVTHDIIHKMLNSKYPDEDKFVEKIGVIEIMDNVFIGSGTRILYDTRIGSNVIVGSDSLVNKDIPDNSVYAGVPARFICTFEEYVEKARNYSQFFVESYGKATPGEVSDSLAQKMYKNFCDSRNQKTEQDNL
ncbi:MAG: acyltransferase [Lachnospiraceae bacterium]|nr:acyltransferase [Lachnospiraceae bacterium]